MSYTMAAVSELQRFADIAPSGIPHKVLTGVKLEGYDLPAGTSVLANLHACHRYGHMQDLWFFYKPFPFHCARVNDL